MGSELRVLDRLSGNRQGSASLGIRRAVPSHTPKHVGELSATDQGKERASLAFFSIAISIAHPPI